ncbi:sodium/hydrogen exchanger 3-like isoform X2 [Dunckerocampus dactyliophorus]|uniref:sodium/hydrogen exchanger 3-like isoform X2 n=1 Tax=Dunckerocampus dactyliophorus TaxID=161453 RepID=UPI0024069749|nr:sodium/hydrogen exchanger 3-like isoform X2 [Dunckerocampus dactyliophorus]
MQSCGYTHIWMLASVLMLGVTMGIPKPVQSTTSQDDTTRKEETQIMSIRWEHVQTPYTVAAFVLLAFLAKLVIEVNHHVTSLIPESALLICFGFILGGIILSAGQSFKLTPTIFFFFLLPQIVLDAGYFMPNRLFFSNMGTILVYAVIGTCWNAASVGFTLWLCEMGGAMGGDVNISLLQYLLFGSLISAVDPVAVFAVFEEVHVNELLFRMFETFVSLGVPNIEVVDIINEIVSFFVVALGGSLLGMVFGLLLSLLTRFTKNIQIIEPGFIFVVGYLSYLTAEMLSLSAILSTVFCGVSCKKYINANMDEKSVTTVRYAMKVLANGSETITFVFLGISAFDKTWKWDTGFVLLTLLFIFVYRFIGEMLADKSAMWMQNCAMCFSCLMCETGIFFLTWIMNKFRLIHLEVIDQIIMSYGGLRGAVAYGLAVMLDDKINEKNLMISTTLIVVYVTVIIQGLTLKPLVTWLKVKRASVAEPTLIETVQNKVFDHMLVAIEDIAGQFGPNYMMDKWNHFEENWVSAILMKPSARKNRDYVFKVFHQLNLKDAISYVAEGERNGSLALIRNQSGFIEMEKKFGEKPSDVMADMACRRTGLPPIRRREPEPFVSLEMHGTTKNGEKQAEDNSHHLLQKHLYKGRKQHRHRYSRSYIDVNKDKHEVQEIFRRTMKSRWEHFKSAKMGTALPKTSSKPQKKDQQTKIATGKLYTYEEEDASDEDSASAYSDDSLSMKVTPKTEAEHERPTFSLESDSAETAPAPPWLPETEADSTVVGPSQGAQEGRPQT